MAKEIISPAVKKRIGYIISDVAGIGAIISIVGCALAGVALAAAYFLPAREVNKLSVETPHYAPRDAGFIKLAESKLSDSIELAKTVPNSKQIARGIYEETAAGKTNPTMIIACARQIDSAVNALSVWDVKEAKSMLDVARLTWAKIAKGEESKLLLNQIIFAKQKIIEAEAYQSIAKAQATIEVISSSIDLEIGKAPSDAAESIATLSLMKKEIMRLKDTASTQDPQLKGYFTDVLAKINTLMAKLQKAR